MNSKILLVDDDRDILETNKYLLSDTYEVEIAASVKDAKAILIKKVIDVAVVDLNFEGQDQDGLSLIDYIQEEMPSTSLIVLSSDHDTRRVVEAMRRPLIDFITKDEESETSIRSAITQALTKKKNTLKKDEFEFKTKSPLMKKKLFMVNQVLASNSSAPILILGESGTGKEYLAKFIASKLGKRLVAANMASIPKETAESELFGHKRGSFTGANSDKIGLLDHANNGVFFLDEIGDCSEAIQAKLLRVIQEKEILPVGGVTPKKIDIRFVAATHRDLDYMVSNESFRLDLLQRINTFTFEIPPLRERPEDIEYYARQFIEELTQGEFFRIDVSGLEMLKKHNWPGNVRELRNVIERVVVYSHRRSLDSDSVISALNKTPAEVTYTSESKVYSCEEIIQALKQANGNRTKAAALLEVHKTTLHRWIKKFNLNDIVESNGVGRPSLQLS
ncbi:MAG: sigma-54 dependent transcriptional regulator [Bacteriovoracaceae bacterium]|nr:sigma-54 dependent transcriptional regulator [Bacteriovoracaceae bacterium]